MKKDVVQILSELINIPSYNLIDSNHAIIHYLKDTLKGCVEITEVKSENGNVNLLIGINTPLRNLNNCILLSGHIDTVASSTHHQPSAKINNGEICGLGSLDMKAFFASVISSLPAIKQNIKPIILSITSDEETDFYGIDAILKKLTNQNVTPQLVIIGEPTSSKFSVANRGNSIFHSNISGKACHSSTPEKGINAVVRSAKMVVEIEKLNKKYADFASLCATSISGGTAPNIVPYSCTMQFSVRTSNMATLTKIKSELSAKHHEICESDEISKLVNVFDIPPFERRKNTYVNSVAKNNNIEITEQNFTTEAGIIQQAFPNSEIVIFGVGNPQFAHTFDERVNIKELRHYSQSLVKLADGYSAYKGNNLDGKDLEL